MKHLTLPASDEAERAAYEGLRRRRADLTHFDLLIEEPTVLYHEGESEPFAVYDVLETRPEALVEALRGVVYESSLRSDGMTGRSRAFGARPRIVLRSMEFCSPFASNTNFPEAYEGLLAFGAAMGEHLRRWRPDAYERQLATIEERILPEWRMVGPFTSAIVNETTALAYHRDSGNFAGSWNAMAMFRENVDGGELVVPGERIAFACQDSAVILMNAQATTHGVTTCRKTRRDGYRYSVVFYALKQLCNCGTKAEELAYGQAKRTEREMRRAGIIP